MNLVPDGRLERAETYRIGLDPKAVHVGSLHTERELPVTAEGFPRYFRGAKLIEPDPIRRSPGDTTLFTTAGVQHIETILKEEGDLKNTQFAVAQPVIRSQYMDRVKDGTSTSFINFSVEHVGASPDEFINLCRELIFLIADYGVDLGELWIQIGSSSDKWGWRQFSNSFFTIYLRETELCECVYIHNYPVTQNVQVPIADISFGVERFNWVLGNAHYYFPEFQEVFERHEDSNRITAIIDCIRTGVLIAGEGIEPSHKDPGYRLRQLSKRFVSRNMGVNLDEDELIRISWEYWKRWGFKPKLSEEETARVIKKDSERNYNVLFLSLLEDMYGLKRRANVNQSTADFLKHVSFNLPKDVVNTVVERMR